MMRRLNHDNTKLADLKNNTNYRHIYPDYSSDFFFWYLRWNYEGVRNIKLTKLYNEFTVGYNKLIKKQKKDNLRTLNQYLPNDIVTIVGEYYQPQQFKKKIKSFRND